MSDHRVHHYAARCVWKGSTGAGYDNYDRTHSVSAPPSQATLTLSSDPAFRGNPELLNPEQLVVMAASSCQLLSFLAMAARAHVDVLEYDDTAEAIMPEAEKPVRIASIQLRPRIVVAAGSNEERLRHLVEVAHQECYIANSLKTPVTVDPQIEFRGGAATS